MILVFTLLSSAAQVLLKFGTVQLKLHPSLLDLLSNFPLIGGICAIMAGVGVLGLGSHK